MVFVGRWLTAVGIAFILFPVAFVLWHRWDAELGYIGAFELMIAIQFFSPKLWLIPLTAGTVFALVWHIFAARKATHRADR